MTYKPTILSVEEARMFQAEDGLSSFLKDNYLNLIRSLIDFFLGHLPPYQSLLLIETIRDDMKDKLDEFSDSAKNARADTMSEEEFCDDVLYTANQLESEAQRFEVDYDEIIDLLQSLLRVAFEQRDRKKETENE